MSSQPIDPSSTSCAGGVPAALVRIRGEIRDLNQTMWAARSRDEVMDTVTEIEALKATLDALELGAVRELEATHAVKAVGWASTQDFVTASLAGTRAPDPRPCAWRRLLRNR